MSLWLSGGTRTVTNEDSGTTFGPDIQEIVVDVPVDEGGQFTVDLTQFNFEVQEVLSVQTFVLNQTITPLTPLASILSSTIVQVTNTIVTGVVFSIGSLARAGQGETVRLLMMVRR